MNFILILSVMKLYSRDFLKWREKVEQDFPSPSYSLFDLISGIQIVRCCPLVL
jgi:hypothetical protein